MTAVILQFDRSRLKCLKKVEPGQARLRDLIRADAEQAIAELEAEARFDDEEADTMLFIGPCGEWRQCDRCFNEINPDDNLPGPNNGRRALHQVFPRMR
jgi:hypothetical protein